MPRQPVIILITCLILFPLDSYAASSCHCFQQRSYRTEAPETIEPYLLTTASNSFIAVTFQLPKRKIVKEKMSGLSNSDLWIGLNLAAAYNLQPAELIDRKKQTGSWAALAQSLPSTPEFDTNMLLKGLQKGTNEETLADIAVSVSLDRYLGIKTDLSLNLLKTQVSRKELVLAALLAQLRTRDLDSIVAEGRSTLGGWAKLSEASGLVPGELEAAWTMVLKQKKAAY